MISYNHRIAGYPKLTEEKIKGLDGWFVVGRVSKEATSFAIVAAESFGKGFKNREAAREAKRALRQ